MRALIKLQLWIEARSTIINWSVYSCGRLYVVRPAQQRKLDTSHRKRKDYAPMFSDILCTPMLHVRPKGSCDWMRKEHSALTSKKSIHCSRS